MKKLSKSAEILIFLGLFGFSLGLFNNYRELWMNANNLSATSISRIIGISSIITVLVLFFFTIKVNTNKLKDGITISLILKMLTSTILICLNNTNKIVLIKFLMFFDIAFTELILSSIYPLIMTIDKSDILYTKKDVVESLFNKLGFLIASIILGKVIGTRVIDYNICYLLSVIFLFISFIVFTNIKFKDKKETNSLDLKESYKYFKKNNIFILFLISNLISSTVWSSIMGMPLLALTEKLNFNPSTASLIILGLGIMSNFLAIIIVKYLRFKNDHLNMIFKYGLRVICYLLVFIIGTKEILLITIVYLLLSDCTYNFIFSGYFINKVDEKYSLFLVVLKYCATLLGNGLGTIICGLTFNLDIKYFALPAFIIGLIHYIIGSILINKKKVLK